jgi:hypothetical protein
MTAASLLERSGNTDLSVFGGTPGQLSDAIAASLETDS